MTSAALILRCWIGLRLMEMRPLFRVVLVPSAPMNEDRLSTAGILEDDVRQFLLLLRHCRKGNGLRGLRNALNHAGILLGEETFRNDDVEIHGE